MLFRSVDFPLLLSPVMIFTISLSFCFNRKSTYFFLSNSIMHPSYSQNFNFPSVLGIAYHVSSTLSSLLHINLKFSKTAKSSDLLQFSCQHYYCLNMCRLRRRDICHLSREHEKNISKVAFNRHFSTFQYPVLFEPILSI